MEVVKANCFVCGNGACSEDSDHERMTCFEFHDLLKERAGFNPQIAHLKFKIKSAFQRLEKKSGERLGGFQADLMLLVDKLHFWDLLRFPHSLKDIEAAIFGFMIPKAQTIRLIHLLRQVRDPSIVFPSFRQLLREVHKFKKNAQAVIEAEDYGRLMTAFGKAISQAEKQQVSKAPAGAARRKPGSYKEEETGTDILLLEGIPFSAARSSLDLSMLGINRKALMRYLPSLSKIRDLKEFYLRNSSLSPPGYKMLLSLFPQLEVLDLGSCSCTDFLASLQLLRNSLKTLYINNCQVSDSQLLTVAHTLLRLRVIFADGNQITSQGVQEFSRANKNIIFMSFKNNDISEAVGVQIQVNMAFSGGYLEF